MQNGRQRGFVYIGLLIGLMIIGIGLGAVSEVWHQSRQREREEELLFVGNQFRQAITRYYLDSPRGIQRFPMNLQELMQDDRSPEKFRRHLRKLYADPMTGKADWAEIRLPGGQLVGVHSQSSEPVLKVAEFRLRDKGLIDKTQYAEWEFRSALPAANPILGPGGSYTTPTSPGQRPSTVPTRPPVATPPGFIQPTPRPRR